MSSHSNIMNPRPKRKPRARPLPPDVTARNLAIEKKRRGEMNDNFLELARLLPGLGSTRRLTKVLIVNKTVEHVRQQRNICLAAAQDMQDLLVENRQLILEVNALRTQVMGPAALPVQAKPMTEAMGQLVETKNHVFGTFPAGFGDNSPDDVTTTPPETSREPYEVTPPMDHSYIAPSQQTTLNLAAENSQGSIEQMPPASLPVSAYQDPQANYDTCWDLPTDPSFMSSLDLFTPSNLFLNSQMIAHTQDTTPTTWFSGIDTSNISGLLQNGYGNGDPQSCI